jgi:hypothetical protein
VTGWYPMDKFAPGDGDDTVEDTEECIHSGVECEGNTGKDACPCRCPECTENELDDDYDFDEEKSDMRARPVITGPRPDVRPKSVKDPITDCMVRDDRYDLVCDLKKDHKTRHFDAEYEAEFDA